MLEALRSLLSELNSLRAALARASVEDLRSADVQTRIEQFFFSWTNLRAGFRVAGVPPEVLERVDGGFSGFVKLSSSTPTRASYIRNLDSIRRLIQQLLLEVAKLEAAPEKIVPTPAAPQALLPEIPGLTNELLPNALLGWTDQMRAFLKTNSYEKNVFIMVAYRRNLEALITGVEEKLEELGLNAVLARDHNLTDDLYNPLACLLCCRFGIAVFGRAEAGQVHNANIVYELAVMQILKRPLLILKHQSLRNMPSDFLHRLYEPYRTTEEAQNAIGRWWERTTRNEG